MFSAATLQSIDLTRRSVATTATTSSGCLVVYPQRKKARQRIAVGDKTGAARVFSLGKLLDVAPSFETSPSGKPVGRMKIYDDQLFFVHGSKIDAYSKKGRLFFSFDTGATESLTKLFIDTPFIYTAGEFMLSSFQETKELGFFMAPDRVNDLDVLRMPDAAGSAGAHSEGDYYCVLGCNDRQLRTVNSSKVVGEFSCDAAVTVVRVDPKKMSAWYATASGSFGMLKMPKSSPGVLRPTATAVTVERRLSAVTALHTADVDQDGVEEVILCREDGSVEIHSTSNSEVEGLSVLWKDNLGESIQSAAAGFITNLERIDTVVHTFSGDVVVFSHRIEAPDAAAVPSALSAKPVEVDVVSLPSGPKSAKQTSGTTGGLEEPTTRDIIDAHLRKVQEDVELLRSKVEMQTQELANEQRRQVAAKIGVAGVAAARAVASTFTVRSTLEPADVTAALTLTVSTDAVLDCVGIFSDVPLRFLETDRTFLSTHRGAGELSPRASAGRAISTAVARPVDPNGRQVQIRFWVDEGISGTIRATVLGVMAPRTAQVKEFMLRPLPLYTRTGERLPSAVLKTMSTLKVSGGFSARDMHSWLFRCISETPDVYQQQRGSDPLVYRHAFDGTVLQVVYGDGVAECASQSLPALLILKTSLSVLAHERSILTTMEISATYASPLAHLQLLAPHLDRETALSRDLKLLAGLRELQGSEGDASTLPANYVDLLSRSVALEREATFHKDRQAQLQRVTLAVFQATYSLLHRTTAPANAIKHLEGTLASNFSLDAVLAIFFPRGEHLAASEATTTADEPPLVSPPATVEEHGAEDVPVPDAYPPTAADVLKAAGPSEQTVVGPS